MEWKDVFALAGKVKKEILAKKPSLSQTEATKAAWKDPRVIKAKDEYNARKGKAKAKPKPKRK